MKGTDVNPDQLSAAETFITDFVTHQPPPADPEQQIIIKWEQLVRLVAWYGALRARGIENGAPVVPSTSPASSLFEQ